MLILIHSPISKNAKKQKGKTMSEKPSTTTRSGIDKNTLVPESDANNSQSEAEKKSLLVRVGNVKFDLPEDRRRAVASIYGAEKVNGMSDEMLQGFINDAVIDSGLSNSTANSDKTAAGNTSHAAGKEDGLSVAELTAKLASERIETAPHDRPVVAYENGVMTNVPAVETQLAGTQEVQAAENSHEDENSEEDAKPVKKGLRKWAKLALGMPGSMILQGWMKLGDRQNKMQKKYENLTDEERSKWNIRTTLGAAAIGVALNFSKLEHLAAGGFAGIGDTFNDHSNGANADELKPRAESGIDIKLMNDEHELIMSGANPAEAAGKLDPYNFGPPLTVGANEQLDAGKFAGYNELVTNRFPNNGHEFASYLANSKIDGVPNPTDSDAINKFGEMLENDHKMYAEYLDKMNGKLEGAKFSEREIVNASYSSYEIDPVTGEVHLNPNVTDTTKVITVTFEDGTVWEVCVNCGQLKMPGEQLAAEVATVQYNIPVQRNYTENLPTGGANFTPEPVIPEVTPAPPNTPTPTPPNTPPVVPPSVPTPTPPNTPPPTEPPYVPPVLPPAEGGKVWDGHVAMPDGIDALKNKFIEWTQESDNNTDSPNLTGGVTPGSEETSYNSDGAAANTAPQVATPEAGAGTSRTEADAAAQQQTEQAVAQQQTANEQAEATKSQMNEPGAVDQAVKDIQTQIGPDGRPN